ncbi:MAG: flavodoxin [Alloprevotella sp.]|nr:flavodoxin [Alloprevotella sp.]
MMPRILIAYFSHAGENWVDGALRRIDRGNTRRVAEKVQVLTGGDLFEIRPRWPYPEDYDACCAQAKAELEADARPELAGGFPDVGRYDRIYLGYPLWYGTMPMPVFTFLERYDFTGKWLIPFSTHEGGGLGSSVDDILRTARGGRTLEAVAFEGSRVEELERPILQWVGRTSGRRAR